MPLTDALPTLTVVAPDDGALDDGALELELDGGALELELDGGALEAGGVVVLLLLDEQAAASVISAAADRTPVVLKVRPCFMVVPLCSWISSVARTEHASGSAGLHLQEMRFFCDHTGVLPRWTISRSQASRGC